MARLRRRRSRRSLRRPRRSSFKRRRSRRRSGSQKIVRRRIRTVNNPFGDSVQVKFKFAETRDMVISNAPGSVWNRMYNHAGAFNDLSQIWEAGLPPEQQRNAPGFYTYPQLFQNYRVTGVKITWNPYIVGWGRGTDEDSILRIRGSTGEPCMAYIIGGDGVTTEANLTPESIPEQRWVAYKECGNWQIGGGKGRRLKLYLSTKKVAGGDRSVPFDDDYCGECLWSPNPVIPYNPYTNVKTQLAYQLGVVASSKLYLGSEDEVQDEATLLHGTWTITYYVTFWGRRPNNSSEHPPNE